MENYLQVVEAATSLNQEAKVKHHEEERQWIDLEEVVMQRKLVVVEERLMLKVVVQRLMLKVVAATAKIKEAKVVVEEVGIQVVQVVMLSMVEETVEEKEEEHQLVVIEEVELKK